MTSKADCCVCGKPLKRGCRCPWRERFEEWPNALKNTIRAMVAEGGEHNAR